MRPDHPYLLPQVTKGQVLGLSDIADGISRSAERLGDSVSGAFDSRIRLGVTGLSRAGKTVFITSLVANLLNRGRMQQFLPEARGSIRAAYLQPHPHDTVPRFAYETHLDALTGAEPFWPDGTRMISELRLSFRLQPTGLVGRLSGPRRVHLDIVDYPGEWLLDLKLMDQSFAAWSEEVLERLSPREEATEFLSAARELHDRETLEEAEAQRLSTLYTDLLQSLRDQGFSDCTPGRFLMPGDLEGAPVLSFAPVPQPERAARHGLWREMERRFKSYKRDVVRPFFQDHFAKIDRQIVLLDTLGAIHRGPAAVEDLQQGMARVLTAFRPGQNGFLTQLWRGRRVEKILFAATKADHLHHVQHPALTAIMEALLRDARDRAEFAGAQTAAMAIAALRTTVEDEVTQNGEILPSVRGRLIDGREAAFYAGELPDDPSHLLEQARNGAAKWLDGDFDVMRFRPSPRSLRNGGGPPHIRLDKAAQFLIGDMG